MKPENQERLRLVANLREQSGKESETLQEVDRLLNSCVDDWECVARLWWEKALTYQHLVMKKINIEENKQEMSESAMKAHEIVENNHLDNLKGDDYRFLGRVADYSKHFEEAKEYYKKALEIYLGKPRELEIKGFMAVVLINLGDVNGGIQLAKTTFDEFDNNSLKQEDYFTWAVWKSGLWPRVVKTLVARKINYNKEELLSYLERSEDILKNPQGEITWGDENFQYRIDEIKEARKSLE